jgi:hypothetical protein
VSKGIELRFVGELAVPQQVCGLFIGCDWHQILDEIAAAIDESAVGAIHLADGGLGGDDTLQPRAELRHEV